MRWPGRGWRAGALAVAALAPAAAWSQPSPQAAVRVEPTAIEVGMLYRGTTVRVEGSAPSGLRVVLECVGEDGPVQLKRKGKVWNLLWMNVGSVSFDRVPSLYLARGEPEGPAEAASGPGYARVEAQVLPASADAGTRGVFRELIRLKEAERLYALGTLRRDSDGASSGALLAGPGAAASPAGRVVAEFELPASAPPGQYQVRMLGYRDGVAEVLASERLTVRRVGLAEAVATMARRHGLLYGILSVAAALAAGLLSGVLFSGAKKGH
ncbi:MAG TPA: TIGR02186 family protein [Anaeromyxobacteraceae bacterium]|nr:TIGR02186 family protein [Anaeromyxobacteraceae bacterium]